MVLLAGLVAAFLGSGVIGWLDPLSLLVRSFGLSLLPAFNAGVRELLAPMEQSHIAMIRTLGEGLHKALQAVLLDLRQPHFAQGVFLGVLFLAILFASLRITRFWCRAICPLGALLGVVSWWSIFGLHKKPQSCDNCNRCLLHCQGGDNPIGGVPWRKSERLWTPTVVPRIGYCEPSCTLCSEVCPTGAIKPARTKQAAENLLRA